VFVLKMKLVIFLAALVVLSATSGLATSAAIGTIFQVANGAGLTTLLNTLKMAGLEKLLTNNLGPLTVFAPTNAAFEALGERLLQTLTQTYNKDWLQQIILYHVLNGDLPASTLLLLSGKVTPATLIGQGIPVTVNGQTIYVGGSKVIIPNVPFLNGQVPSIVHVIDKVIMPPSKCSSVFIYREN
jgi:transforming growth factor-beta-induced protein